MKLNTLLTLSLLILTNLLTAQKDFRPGFIINHTKDTLFGEIDYRNDLIMARIGS